MRCAVVEAACAEDDDRRCRTAHPCHFSPGTMIIEKYGDDIGVDLGQRHDLLVGHGRALDIQRTVGEARARVQHPTHLREVAAELHDHRGIGVGERAAQLLGRQHAGQHRQALVAIDQRRAQHRRAAQHRADAGDDFGRIARPPGGRAGTCRSRRRTGRPRRSPPRRGRHPDASATLLAGCIVEIADHLLRRTAAPAALSVVTG